MKNSTALLITILLLTAGRAAAQSQDAATDALSFDAARPTDGRVSDSGTDARRGEHDAAAVHDGSADGSHGGAPHDAAPAPATPLFLHEKPGCSVGGEGPGDWWTLLSAGLMAVALVRGPRRRQR